MISTAVNQKETFPLILLEGRPINVATRQVITTASPATSTILLQPSHFGEVLSKLCYRVLITSFLLPTSFPAFETLQPCRPLPLNVLNSFVLPNRTQTLPQDEYSW